MSDAAAFRDKPAQARARFGDYLRIARLDHATKHIFIVPGIALAFLLRPGAVEMAPVSILLGFLAAIAIASANYVINEWLDREFDAYHPEKSHRASVQSPLSPRIVYLEYAAFLAVGLALAWQVNTTFLAIAVLFAISGVIYNVKPLRTKDVVYLDVLSESVNNPLRLTLGWVMVDPTTLPPASLMLGFWFGGAFLMNAKRLSEYRDIVASIGRQALGLYRRSFRVYDERRLLVASMLYSIICSFFVTVFLIKYKIEYILILPLVALLFTEYFRLALISNSVARRPERLFKAKRLSTLSALTALAFVAATFAEIPLLDVLTEQHFISLPVGEVQP